MTWIVAGAGALLSMAGLYGLVTGASIIQVERGWATFIAGAVALSAGVITLAIAALMARLERLVGAWTGAVVSRSDDETEASPQPFRPVPPIFAPVVAEPLAEAAPKLAPAAPMFPDLPPLRVEPVAAPEPAPETAAEPEPVAAPEPAPAVTEPMMDEAKDERPAALRDFKFVFPPLEEDKAEDKVEPLKPLEDKTAGRFNLGWLRRNRTDEQAPPPAPRIEPEPFVEPAPAPQAAPALEEAESFETRENVRLDVVVDVAVDIAAEPMPAPDVVIAPEPVAEAPRVEPEKSPDPFSPDWLERALAGDDEKDDAPPPRFVPPSQRRAQMEEPSAPALAVEPAPAPAPAGQVSAAQPLSSDAVEIGRYSANDVSYIMYSDGSITAETATGTFRFGSLIELKDFIERGA